MVFGARTTGPRCYKPNMTRTDLDMSEPDMSTTVRTAPRTVERHARLALYVLEPRGIYVVDRVILVGRAAECDVVMAADTASSRVHLRLEPDGDAVRITDVDSRNGTFLDGYEVHGTVSVSRGVLRFGDTVGVIAAAPDDDDSADVTPLVGGASLAKCRRIISLVAPTDLPLLVTGETGTGKEVVARWAHERSGRSGVLVSVNCAALPESLLEAELFGHVKGAFTGAAQRSRGLIASAAGGTLFLDEVGELPLAVQAKLLRVLEDHVVRPIGADGGAGQVVDFRVISATNVDLRAAVLRGSFRADLYARLSAVEIAMSPLRARIEDLALLVEHLLRRAELATSVSPDALEAIARHAWPQNVRQLDFALRRAAALSHGRLELEHLDDELRGDFRKNRETTPPRDASMQRMSATITRETLEAALREHRGNVRRVGQALKIQRTRLYRLLTKWSIDVEQHRGMSGANDGTAP
jgi:transcriptional regulator with PAS, ATPase and Fis domain